jgi:transketolase
MMNQEAAQVTHTKLANAIRALSMDAVQMANSGHPGAPMGMADIAEVLWRDYLKHNPKNPNWHDRDRFVLSNGHGSMLIYSLLHLSGYDVSISDIKNFRQLGSKTPGHPEYGDTPGVETTTGPLGQGIANAVGMALTEALLANQFNKQDLQIVDHHTYVFAGDGCLMEGISHEACSLAGTLKLGKLIVFYDDNSISIDGDVKQWFSDDTPERFKAYGWQVISDVNGHDRAEIKNAIDEARANKNLPTLICCKTIIGKGSPNKEGTAACHGAALGVDEIALSRENLNWEHEAFNIPQDIYDGWDGTEKGELSEKAWDKLLEEYKDRFAAEGNEFERRVDGIPNKNWDEIKSACINRIRSETSEKEATRKSSERVLDILGEGRPELIGGSADLTGSNNTWHASSKAITADDKSGNYVFYGVREFAMSAIMNGMFLHGGVIPYSGTFLVFSDYARNAVRMAALMRIAPIFVYSHDSVALGEDGPTHQPIEHVNSLRLIPNLAVWRPADATETAVAWICAIESDARPSCVLLTRQGLPLLNHTDKQSDEIAKGGYVLLEPEDPPDAVIISTGSEVHLARSLAQLLNSSGNAVRVVSMPCAEVFDQQDTKWKESVIPSTLKKRISIEAGSTNFWHKYIGHTGLALGIDSFGVSAPGNKALEYFGLTEDSCLKKINEYLVKND